MARDHPILRGDRVLLRPANPGDVPAIVRFFRENEDAVREHARISGFPANKITETTGIIDPTTERG